MVENIQVLHNESLARIRLSTDSVARLICFSLVTEWLTNQKNDAFSWSPVINSTHGF